MPSITRRSALAAAGAAALSPLARSGVALAQPAPALPSDDEVRSILAERIDAQRQSLGIIVGLVARPQPRLVAHGAISLADRRPPQSDTVFAMGSISKVFTAILLADAVQRGEMRLGDPLSAYLPSSVKVPAFEGREITLVDLATHTAGLPTFPDDFPEEHDFAGRVRYRMADAYSFLGRYRLAAAPGTTWLYSNLGYVLIADALSRRTGMDYPSLLRRRLTGPLGMVDTTLAPSGDQLRRLAPGHDVTLKELPREPDNVLYGPAGGICSTAQDMMALVAAFLGWRPSRLAPALASMLQVRRPTGTQFLEQGIGPQVAGAGAHAQVGHSGSLLGYATSILWTPDRYGVVVLSNAAPPVTDIAAHLLDPAMPLNRPLSATSVDAATLDRYAGSYKSDIGLLFVFRREGDVLTFEPVGGAPKVQLTPESEGVFVVARLGARITFDISAPGPPPSVRVEYAGMTYTATRLSDPPT